MEVQSSSPLHSINIATSTSDTFLLFLITEQNFHIPKQRVTSIDAIQHPAIRNAMNMLNMHEIRLTYEADLPARSGLGTSSSIAVGMLSAFSALKGKYADKKKLADEAIYLVLAPGENGQKAPERMGHFASGEFGH